jgi:GTP cyclohydrolase I
VEIINAATKDMENTIRNILTHIGENPDREGLKGTPDRVIRMYDELFRGYKTNPPKVTIFDNNNDGIGYDQMVIDKGTFYSNCEHHMLPFFGTYTFGYIPHPDGKILGLSKVARVVDYFSARLQIQERLGKDIVDYINEALKAAHEPIGIGIILKGEHLCKTMRGVKKQGIMTTTYLLGAMKYDEKARTEFLSYQ